MDEPRAPLLEPLAITFSRPLTVSLSRFPRAVPLQEQRRIVGDAFRRARASGLRLPALLTIEYVAARGKGAQHGQTTRNPDGSVTIFLDVDLWPSELERVTLHEAQHAADAAAGLFGRLSRFELERRAINFAAQELGRSR